MIPRRPERRNLRHHTLHQWLTSRVTSLEQKKMASLAVTPPSPGSTPWYLSLSYGSTKSRIPSPNGRKRWKYRWKNRKNAMKRIWIRNSTHCWHGPRNRDLKNRESGCVAGETPTRCWPWPSWQPSWSRAHVPTRYCLVGSHYRTSKLA